MIPAFATTTSTGPSSASTAVNAASIEAASVTSACTVSTPSGPFPSRAVTATRWPAAANASAIARPIPRLPPVTSTVRAVNAHPFPVKLPGAYRGRAGRPLVGA